MIVRRESTIINYHAPFDQGFMSSVFVFFYDSVVTQIRTLKTKEEIEHNKTGTWALLDVYSTL